MKIKKVFFADTALIQYTYKFNKTNMTDISICVEYKEGIPFSEINFKDTSSELIFEYAYDLAIIQNELSKKQIWYLDTNEYPMPSVEDKNYKRI